MRDPLYENVEKSFHELIALIETIPYDFRYAKIMKSNLSVIEGICEQIGWAELLLAWHQGASTPQDLTWKIATINQNFHREYGQLSYALLLSKWKEAIQAILSLIETEEAYLDEIHRYPWCTLKSGKPWPLRKWIQVNTVAPYQRFKRNLRSALSQADSNILNNGH